MAQINRESAPPPPHTKSSPRVPLHPLLRTSSNHPPQPHPCKSPSEAPWLVFLFVSLSSLRPLSPSHPEETVCNPDNRCSYPLQVKGSICDTDVHRSRVLPYFCFSLIGISSLNIDFTFPSSVIISYYGASVWLLCIYSCHTYIYIHNGNWIFTVQQWRWSAADL